MENIISTLVAQMEKLKKQLNVTVAITIICLLGGIITSIIGYTLISNIFYIACIINLVICISCLVVYNNNLWETSKPIFQKYLDVAIKKTEEQV